MTQWTPQQQAAIDARERSVIVSAAAGSGKTAVLVERLLQILSDPQKSVPAESIVVVTFTNDAAAQMKQRLYQAFSDALAALDPKEEETYVWLLRQQSALGTARISTINSFCFELIRENADYCGVSSQFRVCEPGEERIYGQQALEKVLTAYSKEHRAEMEQLFSVLCTQNDAELEPFILSIAGYLKSVAFPELWLRKARSLAGNTDALLAASVTSLRKELAYILRLTEACRPYAEAVMPDSNRFPALLDEDIQNIRLHYEALDPGNYSQILENPALFKAEFSNFPGIRKNVNADAKKTFKALRDHYKELYNQAIHHYLEPLRFLKEDMQLECAVLPKLLDLTEAYLEELMLEKKRRNVLSFDDGERLALNLLGYADEEGVIHSTELAHSLSRQYNIIMVDEYQDSNNKQDCLFKLLSRDSCFDTGTGRLRYGNNAFLVGDVKQSIYSFRLANPRNFMDALADSIPLAECGKGDIARIYLNQNFRSSEGVINFVNAFFRHVMSAECGEVAYDRNEYLNFGAMHYENQTSPTTLLFPDENADVLEEQDPQAVCIADTIAEMISQKIPVTLRNGTTRCCQPKDFCILLRSVKKESAAFLQALEERGIAASCSDGEETGFLNQPEIRLITNFLRILDNPLSDVPLAAVLVSPVYGFTSEDLLCLRLYAKRSRLYLQLCCCADEKMPEKEQAALLAQKCRAFLAQFAKLREASAGMPLDELITVIYDETDLLSLQSLYDNADEQRHRLAAYVSLAQSYRTHGDLNGKGTLSGWLHYIDHLLAVGSDVGDAELPKMETDCVSIKTIHKSKGLEYPFVFLAHLDSNFSTQPSYASVLPDDSGRIGLRVINKETCQRATTVSLQYILHDVYRKQRSEEMRLLYVAMTRAQQQLFLLMGGSRKKHRSNPMKHADLLRECPQMLPDLVRNAGSMEEWVYMFLLATSEAEHLMLAVENGEASTSQIASYQPWNGCSSAEVQNEKQAVLQSLPDPHIIAELQNQLAFSYHSPMINLIAKHSVTTLAHPESAFSEHLDTPEFLSETKRTLRGAKKGTAVHKMLQYMDFSAASRDSAAELQRLRESGYLTDAEADTLSAAHLQAFFSSDLYRRIAASDTVYKEKQLFVRIGELGLPENTPLLQEYAGTDGILIGTMDLLFREGDSWVLVDYKTDQFRTKQQLLDSYSLQLGLYQKAVEKILGAPVRQAFLYSFVLDEAIEVDLDHIKYEAAVNLLADT